MFLVGFIGSTLTYILFDVMWIVDVRIFFIYENIKMFFRLLLLIE